MERPAIDRSLAACATAIRTSHLKRLTDVVGAAVLLSFTLPASLSFALLIKCRDPDGPVLFVQEREGLDSRPFRCFKFRTMYTDAEQRLHTLLASDALARQQWERYYELAKDPRVIPGIGQFLRASALDELPNLVNVLRGEMSLVGPRPFPEYHLRQFDASVRRVRCLVRPGITGLWQLHRGDIEAQQHWDMLYLERWSNLADIAILLRTIPHVLLSRRPDVVA